MTPRKLLSIATALLMLVVVLLPSTRAASQDASSFELPVQLIGFPTIILAVRVSNFIKKLTYAVNANTYRSRTRRGLAATSPTMDVQEVEKKLVAEMGERVCVYERVCEEYAMEAEKRHRRGENNTMDWPTVFSKYESSPESKRQFYLLSVFLGDIVASPTLCHKLAKRGRSCQ